MNGNEFSQIITWWVICLAELPRPPSAPLYPLMNLARKNWFYKNRYATTKGRSMHLICSNEVRCVIPMWITWYLSRQLSITACGYVYTVAKVAELGGGSLLLDRFLCDRYGAAFGFTAIFTGWRKSPRSRLPMIIDR